jgi:hypothetical protein
LKVEGVISATDRLRLSPKIAHLLDKVKSDRDVQKKYTKNVLKLAKTSYVTSFLLLFSLLLLLYYHQLIQTHQLRYLSKNKTVLRVQIKSWAGKALETVNCRAFLKRRLIGEVDSNLKFRAKKYFFFFFLCNVLHQRIT